MGFEIIVAFLSGVFCFLLCVLFCCAVGGSLSTGLGGEFVSCCKSLFFLPSFVRIVGSYEQEN